MIITKRKVRDKFNQLSCFFLKNSQATLSLGVEGGSLTVFHDYEGEYAKKGKGAASLYGVNRILDIEKKYGVHATFNTVGKLMQEVPEVVKRIVEENHELASHSYSHQILSLLNRNGLERDLRDIREVFESYGLTLKGVRSPQSRWSFLQTKVMLENGLTWSAENDKGQQPYFVQKRNGDKLLRLPIMIDDWEYISHGLSPDEMYARWISKVDQVCEKKSYGAIGFHPWIQGESEGRLEAFEKFIAYVANKKDLRTVTFSEAYHLVSRTGSQLN